MRQTLILVLLLGVLLSDAKPKTVMGIGDSLTQGSGDESPSYIVFLRDLLSQGGYDVEFIGPNQGKHSTGEYRNCGFGGKNVEYIAERIDSLYAANPADILLLQCGHNHFMDETPVPGMIEAYRQIIQTVRNRNPRVRILVAKVVESGKLPKYGYMPQLNRELEKMVKEYRDKNILFANVSKGFDWKQHTGKDLVHPTPEGVMEMARNWYDALVRSRWIK